MKKLNRLLLLMLIFTVPLFAGTRVVHVNPVGLAFGVLNAGVEFVNPSGLNPVVDANFYLYSSDGWSTFGLGVAGGMRKYFSDDSGNGPYIFGSGSVGIVSAKLSLLGESASTNTLLLNIAGGAGYQTIFNEKFVAGLEGGFNVWVSSGIKVTMYGIPYELGHYSGLSPYGAFYIGIKI